MFDPDFLLLNAHHKVYQNFDAQYHVTLLARQIMSSITNREDSTFYSTLSLFACLFAIHFVLFVKLKIPMSSNS